MQYTDFKSTLEKMLHVYTITTECSSNVRNEVFDKSFYDDYAEGMKKDFDTFSSELDESSEALMFAILNPIEMEYNPLLSEGADMFISSYLISGKFIQQYFLCFTDDDKDQLYRNMYNYFEKCKDKHEIPELYMM